MSDGTHQCSACVVKLSAADRLTDMVNPSITSTERGRVRGRKIHCERRAEREREREGEKEREGDKKQLRDKVLGIILILMLQILKQKTSDI